MSTRITQSTRTSGSQNLVAASSAATFSTRTDDPSLSTVMAPALTVTLGFGKQSGLRAVSKQPAAPQWSPESPPVEKRWARRSAEIDSGVAADTESGASEPADVEINKADPAEHDAVDLPSERREAEASPDHDASQFDGESNLQPVDQLAEQAVDTDAAPPADPESDEPVHPHPHRIEMTIDSLPHHDLTEPIPIYIDPLGDTVFTATVAHLDIAATGNSIGEALVQLKEQIEFRYGDLNRRPKRTPEQTTMLQMMHTYIAPTGNKPAWL